MAWSIVGKRFTDAEFADYVEGLDINGGWTTNPRFITLHNTATPSLAQRPKGFTETHIKNLHNYYVGKGWNGGPHLFIDQNGIWVFNPLTRKGTHSPSYNNYSIGVEMLGDYAKESFASGPGALVRGHSVFAVAVLSKKLDFDPSTMKLHKEDPRTDHDCPGKNVGKQWFVGAVAALLNDWKDGDDGPADVPVKVIVNGVYDASVGAYIDPEQDFIVARMDKLAASIGSNDPKETGSKVFMHAATYYRSKGYDVAYDNVNKKLYVNKRD